MPNTLTVTKNRVSRAIWKRCHTGQALSIECPASAANVVRLLTIFAATVLVSYMGTAPTRCVSG